MLLRKGFIIALKEKVELALKNGIFEIISGEKFAMDCGNTPVMAYTREGTHHVECRDGAVYDMLLSIPRNTAELHITLTNAALHIREISAGSVEIMVSDSSVSADSITAGSLYIRLGKGNVCVNAKLSNSGDFETGYGDMAIRLESRDRTYTFDTMCGAGTLVINANAVPRNFQSENRNGIPIKAKCGLGTLSIMTEC